MGYERWGSEDEWQEFEDNAVEAWSNNWRDEYLDQELIEEREELEYDNDFKFGIFKKFGVEFELFSKFAVDRDWSIEELINFLNKHGMAKPNPESRIMLVKIMLSKNKSELVEDCPLGVNGKINIDKNGLKYYLTVFKDPNNPFVNQCSRIIRQELNSEGIPIWKLPPPIVMSIFKNKLIYGAIVTNYVLPYDFSKKSPKDGTFTAVVFGVESFGFVFGLHGYLIP